MDRLVIICLIIGWIFPAEVWGRASDSTGRPNVILIVSHGHGRNDLGCYGNTIIKTPNLDNLASEGVILTNAFGTTTSQSTSHSVILTGLYGHATGQYGLMNGNSHFSLFPEIKGITYFLKEKGYRTARIGEFPLSTGEFLSFDTVLGQATRNGYEMAEQCKGFMIPKTGAPFFLYFCPSDPYRSQDPEDGQGDMANSFGNRGDGYENIVPTYYRPEKMKVPSYLTDSPETRAELAHYAQAVSRMDLGLGRLFTLLKKTGQWENTLIVYLSDGGPAFPLGQMTFYEPSVHLPCIVKPSQEKPVLHSCDAMVCWADIVPTILDYCDATPADYFFHGRSFRTVLGQEHSSGWEEIFASHTFHEVTMYYPMRMVRTPRYKLIWNIAWQLPATLPNDIFSSVVWQNVLKSQNQMCGPRNITGILQKPQFELYDELNDPDELTNLADDPQNISIKEQLKSRIKVLQMITHDPWVIFW